MTDKLSGTCHPPRSMLIVLMGSMGDVIRGLCLVAHLKSFLPGLHLTWLVEPQWAALVRFHPLVDRIIVFDRPQPISGVYRLWKALSEIHFDVTLDLQRHLKSGFFSKLSGAPRRIGFHRQNTKERNWLFNNEHIPFFPDSIPKLVHYLSFARYLGLPEPETLDFGFSRLTSTDAPRSVQNLAPPLISIVMGSSWESKDWFFEGYRGLLTEILDTRKESVILLGDRSKEKEAARLSEQMASPRVLNLVGKTTLLELAATLKKSVVAVGPDSGPGHLSAAVGTPYVSLFGPTSPDRVVPYGCRHLVVAVDLDCAPCNQRRCSKKDRPCMKKITVNMVVEKIATARHTGLLPSLGNISNDRR
jgi:heptosyltransferase I